MTDTPDRVRATEPPDVWGLVLAVFALLWILLTTTGIHLVAWVVEQFMIVQDLYWPIWVWPLIAVGHAVLLLIPLTPLALFWRRPRYRAVFRTWMVAALFVLFLSPARLASHNQEQVFALVRGACILVWLAVEAIILRVWRSDDRVRPRPGGPYLPALLLAPVLSYAWLAWGSLGSFLDTVLNLVTATLYGAVSGLTFGVLLMDDLDRTGKNPIWDIALGGVASSASLLVMTSALGSNGHQLFLMLSMSALGFVLALLAYGSRVHRQSSWLSIALLVALSTAAPLLMVDPDELLLVLNLGTRDVMAWTLYASLTSLATSLLVATILFLMRHRLSNGHKRGPAVAGISVTWTAGVLLYALVGQPGLHGDRVLVILTDQADVSSAPSIPDDGDRRQYVYETLVAHANRTQQRIRAPLDRLGVSYTPYYLVNALEVRAGALLRLWLETRPEVDRVLHSPVLRPLPVPPSTSRGLAPAPDEPQWNLTTIGADRVWQELGVTGSGIVIGQSDSGAQWTHPELQHAYRGQDGKHDFHWFDPWNHTSEPTDIGGHGTHTLGSILGRSVGVAPGAQWYACVNLARNLGNPARYLDCMQFMLAPFPQDGDPWTDGDPARGAHILNNSWGCPQIEGCDPLALVAAVRALRAAGVFVVVSAGNEGPICGSVSSPLALYDEAFSVGAVDSIGKIALFSSRGPVSADGSSRTKPDLLAPGVEVLSSYPNGTYYNADGTSMAGPHVAGVVALIWSANPALIGEIERTEQILIETARPYDYARHGVPPCGDSTVIPDNAVGYGLVDAYAAVERAQREAGQP